MYRTHSIQEIQKIKDLRRSGHSINDLVRILSIPKTTIWHHIQSLKILPKYSKILRERQGGSKIKKEKELLKAKEEAKQLLDTESRDLYIIAPVLYWAEGSKRRCEFVNTDGEMIKLYLKIIRGNFKISENLIQPVLRIFSNHDKNESLNYWSKITKIPETKFQIYFNDGGISGRTPYGMCRIVVRRGGYLLKLFKAIINQLCADNN
jgi:biotin operon repressor